MTTLSADPSTLCASHHYYIFLSSVTPLIPLCLGCSLDALDASYCHGDDPNFDPQYPDTQPGGYNKAEDCGKYKATKVISTSYAYVGYGRYPPASVIAMMTNIYLERG